MFPRFPPSCLMERKIRKSLCNGHTWMTMAAEVSISFCLLSFNFISSLYAKYFLQCFWITTAAVVLLKIQRRDRNLRTATWITEAALCFFCKPNNVKSRQKLESLFAAVSYLTRLSLRSMLQALLMKVVKPSGGQVVSNGPAVGALLWLLCTFSMLPGSLLQLQPPYECPKVEHRGRKGK